MLAGMCSRAREFVQDFSCDGRRRRRGLLIFALFTIATPVILSPSNPKLAVRDPVRGKYPSPDWRPNEGEFSPDDCVGAKTCAACHVSEAKTQSLTPMNNAATPVAGSTILQQHPILQFRSGPYAYRIVTQGAQASYTVTDGAHEISAPILWAFGQGEAGQTYVLQWQGKLLQSSVSFFNDIQGLDFTLGVPNSTPETLNEALGARLTSGETRLCFGCHTTAAFPRGQSFNDRLVPGVTCEACHGPGARHIAAMKEGHAENDFIYNPATLPAGDLDDFCGACHRTWLEVEQMNIRGVANVRFQPYRLAKSRCWSSEDLRIACLACHNPHEPLRKEASFYDTKCLACHMQKAGESGHAGQTAARCPVSTQRCTSCHMPKYPLPGGHFRFTDHWIRVAKPGEPYPS